MIVKDYMCKATDAHDMGDYDTFNAFATTLAVLGWRPIVLDGINFLDGWRNGDVEVTGHGHRRWTLEHSRTYLCSVHNQSLCEGQPCTIHNRSDHHMRSWPQHWRDDTAVMERTCPHGVGHPDPDSPWPWDSSRWIHGCDGCCDQP